MGCYWTNRQFHNCKKTWHDFHWWKHHDCQIIDFAVPYDTRLNDKEVEKTKKCLDLARELKKVWNMNVTVVGLVVGALGTLAKALEKILKTLRQKLLNYNYCLDTYQQNSPKSYWEVRSLVDTILQKQHISVGRNQCATIH